MTVIAPAGPGAEPVPAAVLRLEQGRSVGEGVRSGARWILGARIASQVLQFVTVLVTARLLVPSDYGKMAVVYPVVGFAVIFTNLGLNSTVIHVDHLTERLLSTAFWMNALSGLALGVVVAALSFPLAALMNEPTLVPLVCLASLGFVIQVAVVHNALLERTFRFRQIAVIETAGAVVGFTAIVVLAAAGLGPYALVLGPLFDAGVKVVLLIARVRYLPRRWLDRESARELWSHGRGVTGFNVVSFWSRNADNLLLAGVASQSALGNYNRAYNLMRLPVDQTLTMMSRVMYPAMARLRHDPARLGAAWLKAMSVAVVVTAPVALLLSAAAPAAVEVLLGDRWLGMVPVLELLALSALPQVLIATAPGLLRATGHTDLLFRVGLMMTVMTVLAIVVGLPWSTRGVALALLVKLSCDVPWVLALCARKAQVPYGSVLRALRGGLVACGALLAVGYALRVLLEGEAAWAVLLVQTVACGAAYVAVLAATDRVTLRTALSLARRAGA